MENVIVVGGGLAGLRTAQALREQGYRGALSLVGAEPHGPYDRPPLSKEVLSGASDDTALPADWTALDCRVHLGRRVGSLRLDPDRPGGVLGTATGELPFDGLVAATGAAPVRLPGEGPQHVVRTLDDALALRAALRPGARVVVVGAGWIGAEVATAAAAKGCAVTVLEAAPAPLADALDPEVGALTARWYAEAGVELHCGVAVRSVDHGGLTLGDGGQLAADVVVTGIGARPETGWLAGSGLALDRGVAVDASLRTARPEVVAVGDCAARWSHRYGRRLPGGHWDDAVKAAEVAAAALLGRDEVYDPVPYFWSDQFGRTVQYAGDRAAADRVVLRGAPDGPGWTVLWLDGDRLAAVLAVDRPRDLLQGRRLAAAGTPVDPDLLADPDRPLRAAALAAH